MGQAPRGLLKLNSCGDGDGAAKHLEFYERLGMPFDYYFDLDTTDTSLQAKLDNDSQPVDVTVDRIFPMADPGGHTTTVKFNLPEGTGAHSGMYAEVLIPDPTKKSSEHPVIPSAAILWRGSLPPLAAGAQPEGGSLMASQ